MPKVLPEATVQARRRAGLALRDARVLKGLKQSEVAEIAGVTGETISRIERGVVAPTIDSLVGIAEAVGVPLSELLKTMLGELHGSDERPIHEADHLSLDVYDGYVKNDLPVIAEGEASPQGELFWDASEGRPLIEAEEWTSRPFDLKDPKAYAIKVRGDSMQPVFQEGMLLIVSPNALVKPKGDNAYVQLHNGERLVKFVRKQAGGWILESYNSAYETRFVPGDEVGTLHRIVYAKF